MRIYFSETREPAKASLYAFFLLAERGKAGHNIEPGTEDIQSQESLEAVDREELKRQEKTLWEEEKKNKNPFTVVQRAPRE